ncbi:hypothetical protein GCM10023144_01480 [Pigmentiphaga soli]|uniref:MarR family transcriptional regulator n=1 Tax=Pigmentiphaga soli TaxID=1007095 RepID=A0ABP8GCS5_9BURK
MAYDFSGLTPTQQALLTFGGWDLTSSRPQPSRRSVAKLIERGLVVETEAQQRVHNDRFTLTVRTYVVPLDVHIAWCERCSRRKQEEPSHA